MVQTVATLISLLAGASALSVIGFSLVEEWDALTRALGRATPPLAAPLPRHVRQIAPARRARMVRLTPSALPLRAAAA